MREEFTVFVEGRQEIVIGLDREEEILSAKAEDRAVFGFWDSRQPEKAPFGVPCLVERREDITEEFLEGLVRRHLKLPWKIAETERLLIREFCPQDWKSLLLFLDEAEINFFSSESEFLSYLEYQYSFYEYGVWAVLEKETNALAGAAGIWDGYGKIRESEERFTEIGYWIRPLSRCKGYGSEAVRAVLDYAEQHEFCPIYAKIREDNMPSRKLAENLGFRLVQPVLCADHSSKASPGQTEARRLWYQYAVYC